MLLLPTCLPDAHVRKLPVLAHIVDQLAQRAPQIVRYWRCKLVVQICSIQQLAINVQLQVKLSRIANTNRLTVLVASQVVQCRLGYLLAAINGVDDLHRVVPIQVLAPLLHKRPVVESFIHKTYAHKGIYCE